MRRWLFFLLAIGLGFFLGWYYTTSVDPVQVIDTTPDTLRTDYQTDYVLMVAEVYQSQGDPSQAARSLALLGAPNPAESVRTALQFATDNNYPEAEQALLLGLLTGLQQWNPSPAGAATP